MGSLSRTFRSSFLFVAATASLACGESSSAPSAPASTPSPSPAPVPSYGLALVPLLTYEGSGQAVHPDGATTPVGWGAMTQHVVATPYPNSDARVENPSYYDVVGASTWVEPGGMTNPLATPSPGAHLSDPDMLYDPDTRSLWVYYREVTSDSNRIELIRSKDGSHWDTPTTVVAVPRHFAISPTVVRRSAHDWLMWTVNGGPDGCTAQSTTVDMRHSTNGVEWGSPETVRLGTGKLTPWHLDVEWIPSRNEFWGVYNAKKSGSCMTEILRFATSPDGVTWTEYPSPLLRASVIPEFNDVVYRASVAYDSTTDAVTLLYSGARAEDGGKYTWRVATEQLDRRALMARITAIPPISSSHDRMPGSRDIPVLTNETAP